MQSVCLDEFGGEKALDPSTQDTTLIQHIFGGHLQSQVGCWIICNVIAVICLHITGIWISFQMLDNFTLPDEIATMNLSNKILASDFFKLHGV